MTAEKKLYRPISEWTGLLILPQVDGRNENGGVFILLSNTPDEYCELKGKRIPLVWEPDVTHGNWYKNETVDINFNEDTLKSINEKNIHPSRLDGWKNVSPLESLAGSREQDDVTVMVKNAEVRNGKNGHHLITEAEPVQISGTHYGLVTFRENTGPHEYRILHYNSETGTFDGAEEFVICSDIPMRNEPQIPQSSLKNIEKSELNNWGWYIYGEFNQEDKFVISAIKPRFLFQVNYTSRHKGIRATKHYIKDENWKNSQKGAVEKILLDAWKQNSEFQVDPYHMIKEGNSYLLFHLFGWIGGEKGDSPGSLVPGHSSPGIATVIRDPFTGELQWDIEYKQVYCHNPEGIIAGSVKWHCYMGSLNRGWMYCVPVSDSIMLHPALSKYYEFDGFTFSPLKEIESGLYRIMARMRSGCGTGLSPVNMATSCSQDTAMTFDSVFRLISREYFNRASIKHWIKGNPTHEQTIHLHQLMALFIKWENYFKPLFIAPRRWRAFHRNKTYKKILPGFISRFFDALMTSRSIFPRSLHDGVGKIVLDSGGAVWLLRSNLIGGEIDGIEPLNPTIFKRKSRKNNSL